jgi:hypothetical protein
MPNKPLEAFYLVRQMTIVTAAFNKNVSHCHGDSGSGVFLAAPSGLEYDEYPGKLPDGIELKDGLPILTGLVSQYPSYEVNMRS